MANNTTWKKLLLLGFTLQFLLIFYLIITTSSRISCPACQPIPCPACETHIDRDNGQDYEDSNVISKELSDYQTSNHRKSKYLNFYTLNQFASRGWKYPLNSKLCVSTKGVQPAFIICAHEPSNDIYVSKSIINNGYWETDMAQWLSAFISQIEPDTLYIDLGANLGIHGLHAAKSNCTVWAVEPQEQNLQKIIHSSIFSGTNHRMTFVKNAVDGVRRQVQIAVDKTNNGGSQIKELQTSETSVEVVQTVLLSDIFKEAFDQSLPKNVIIKADIETYECRTFLQSSQVFEHASIMAVVFEWAGVTENCSAEDFKKVIKLMRKSGFKLYGQKSGNKWHESIQSDDQLMARKGANLFWSKISPKS